MEQKLASDFEQIFMSGPDVNEKDILIVVDMLRNGWYGKNAYHYVEKFEKDFAEYHERKFALMTPNCTHAIHLILTAIGVGELDEVIVPESTWIASAVPVTYLKSNIVFADVDEDNWCLNYETIVEKITDKTKAIIAVDLYGNMPNYDELERYCEDKGIYLIEDAAEALGSIYHNRRAGNFGFASVFSFHRTKTLTTGEGGILLLDDEKIYKECKILRDHGRQPGSFYNTQLAFKYMPSNLSAALGFAQFQRIDELVSHKQNILRNYKELFNSIRDLKFNQETNEIKNGAWSTVMVLGDSIPFDSAAVLDWFEKNSIPARPFFHPLSSLPAFAKYKNKKSELNKNSQKLFTRGLCLPSASNLSKAQQTKVYEVFKDLYDKYC